MEEQNQINQKIRQRIINQSVAILCDGNNIERSIHAISNNKNAI